MRCREARHRLTGSGLDDAALRHDQELMEHLKNCPECAEYAEAAGTLRQMLTAASSNDSENVVPMSQQRELVERRLAEPAGRAADMHGHRRRLRYGIGIAVGAVVLVLASLIPFGYDRTIGYDVAFGGVCEEVAFDDEKICDLLYDLGLDQADIGAAYCDTTCSLRIIELRSLEEAELVVQAFSGLCKIDPTADVIPVVERGSGSLLDQANEKIFTGRSENTGLNGIQ